LVKIIPQPPSDPPAPQLLGAKTQLRSMADNFQKHGATTDDADSNLTGILIPLPFIPLPCLASPIPLPNKKNEP